MRLIRSKDTRPEVLVRRLLAAHGYRYRLHRKDLPGKPDLVFPGRRKVILVHGCFWHQHGGCIDGRAPKSNSDYWRPKLLRNRSRDIRAKRALSRLGWKYLVLWECYIERGGPRLLKRLQRFLSS